MNACSSHKFGEAQQALRQETLAKLRVAKSDIGDVCREFEVRWREFLTRLDATPRQVVYRYYRTREVLLDQLDRVDELRSFLTRQRRGERFLSKGHLLDRAAVVQRIVGIQRALAPRPSRATSPNATPKEALSALEARRSQLELELAALDRAWRELVHAVQSILQCLKELSRRGVVAADDPLIVYLEEVLFDYFEEEVPRPSRKIRQPDTAMKAKAAFATLPLRKVFHQALGEAAKSIAAGIPRAVAKEKRNLLQGAARQLVARLKAWRERPRFSELEQAILALHFTFTSARRGWGGIRPGGIRRCQTELEEASKTDILSAVRLLVERGLLSESELDVFRYTPSVWQAWHKLRESGNVEICKCPESSHEEPSLGEGRNRVAGFSSQES